MKVHPNRLHLPVALACLPLLCTLPLSLRAWSQSYLDSWDWVFYLLFIPTLLVTWRRSPVRSSSRHPHGLFMVLGSLALLLLGLYKDTHALLIFGAQLCWWSAFCWHGGWQRGQRFLPAFILLALGIPSTNYWLCTFLGLSTAWGMPLKMLFTVVSWCWLYAMLVHDLHVSFQPLCFSMLWLLALFLLLHSHRLTVTGHSFTPTLPVQLGDFWGRAVEPDGNDRRFFATSTLEKVRYFTPANHRLDVLHVICGDDLHEIHPVSICLQTSQWTLAREHLISPWKDFHVQETLAQKGHDRLLLWTWYSNSAISTPSFLGFRRNYHVHEGWHFFQISMPLAPPSPQEARQQLADFLHLLKPSSSIP